MTERLKAPYPWFGGKFDIAPAVWERIGRVQNLVDPFCGSAAFALACPYDPPVVTLNDADGFVANFWRATTADPDAVARWLDWPVNEIDLFARHVWLIRQRDTLRVRLETDPEWYDAKIAGWWCWGACAWIGSGWCSGDGPWTVEDGAVVNRGARSGGVRSKLPHLGNAGQGVNRQLPHLGDAGRGVNRQLPHLGDAGRGDHLADYMGALRAKLRGARVACGDWKRVIGPSITYNLARNPTLTAVILDPPYGAGAQEYAAGGNGDGQIARDVWAWAIANGDNPLLRIAVCAYDDGRDVPAGWATMRYVARKGYQTAENDQRHREVVYFSPHCLSLNALPLFAALDVAC